MKPVRRKIRRHFGLTSKRLAVRSHRPWYFQLVMPVVYVLIGYGIAYKFLFTGDIDVVRAQLKQTTLENRTLEAKLIGAERELQVELATNNTLAKQLASVQDENLKIKQDLFFYKNMLGKKNAK